MIDRKLFGKYALVIYFTIYRTGLLSTNKVKYIKYSETFQPTFIVADKAGPVT